LVHVLTQTAKVPEPSKEWFFMLLKKQKETKGPRFSAAFLKDWES